MALKPVEVSRFKQLLRSELDAKRKDIWQGSIGGIFLAVIGFLALSALLYILIGMTFVLLKFFIFTGTPQQEWGTFHFVYAKTFLLLCFIILVVMAIFSRRIWPQLKIDLPETPRLFLDDAESPSEPTPSRLLRILFAFPRYVRVMFTNLLFIRRMDLSAREFDLAVLYILSLDEPIPVEDVIRQGEGYSARQRKTVLAILSRLEYVRLKEESGRVFALRGINSERLFDQMARERRTRRETSRSIGYGTR